MGLETAAKILEANEGEDEVKGDFWIDNEHYKVALDKPGWSSFLMVGITYGDASEKHDYLSGEGWTEVETAVGLDSERKLVQRTGNPELPETDEELEAYVRKAIKENTDYDLQTYY